MARNNWNNEYQGENLWGVKVARAAASENRRKAHQQKFDNIPEDSTFFKKERDKANRNNDNRNNRNDNRNNNDRDNNRNNRNDNRNDHDDNRNNRNNHDDNRNNHNRNNNRNDNRNNHDDNRNNRNRNESQKRKAGVRGTDQRSLNTVDREPQQVDKLAAQRETLNAFITDYIKTAKTSGSMIDVIDDHIENVAAIVKEYYEPKYNDIISEMNDVINIMTTKVFMSALYKAMDSNMIDNWETIWNDVARTLSIVIETSHTKMQDEVITMCVDDILSSKYIWKVDIDKLKRTTGITDELATELIIAIPVLEEDFTDSTLKLYCPKFLRTILDNAKDNIDVLIKSVQYDLMTTFFGKDRSALKVIGRYLDASVEMETGDRIEDAVIDEFYEMIYAFLDDFDINDIEFVLSFLSKRERSRCKDAQDANKKNEYVRVFDRDHVREYPNISKALKNIDKNKADVGDYL